MHFRFFFTCVLFMFVSLSALAQLTITVTAPSNTPATDVVYMGANFNGWNPSGTALTNNGNGTHSVTINPASGMLQFKFTRGSWDSVEGDANGGEISNRTYTYNGQASNLNASVLTWKDLIGTGGNTHTANSQVSVMSADFWIPQLNRTRRVWLYLPVGYDPSANTAYPVLYMHDGQNLFDQAESFSGEWQVDETLSALQQQGQAGIIVVGIDNGGSQRIDEYSAWHNNDYNAGGEGEAYADFLANTLKPYIDSHYPTLPDAAHTGIMGSSLGGLISCYAAAKYPQIFGRVGIFSPAFWFNKPQIYDYVSAQSLSDNQKYYLLCGATESTDMVPDMLQMHNTLLAEGVNSSHLQYLVYADGQHSEWFWAREFGAAVSWLFADYLNPVATPTAAPVAQLRLMPNPTHDTLLVQYNQWWAQATELQLLNSNGTLALRQLLYGANVSIAVGNLPKGVYIAQLSQRQQVVAGSQQSIIIE